MKTVCGENQCAGCMACVNVCSKGAIEVRDELDAFNAVIQEDRCIDCGACYHVCQRNRPAEVMLPIKWYQGWAENPELRSRCSSGGFATAISEAFITSGGVVCGCVFRDGQFCFEFSEKGDDIQKFAGSKYVKSNPADVYAKIKIRLAQGQKVLFIGLPCQVSALRNFVGEKLQEKLYSIDLICHGTPSPKLLGLFLKQYNISLSQLEDIQFRKKAKYQVYGNHEGIVTNGVSDRYSIAFLNSLVHTENCYSCFYARLERVSDLTLGDSWGSDLAPEEQKKGISLALCQTEKGMELLKIARLHLAAVDLDQATASNRQLRHPSEMPEGRKRFFKSIGTRSFNSLVFYQFPKQCLRQTLKEALIQTKLYKA